MRNAANLSEARGGGRVLLPAGEVPGGGETMAGDTLAVTAVVALVHLTLAAGELRPAAALLGTILTLEARALV